MDANTKIIERKLTIKERGPFQKRYRPGITTHPYIERMMFDEFMRWADHCGHYAITAAGERFADMLKEKAP